MCYPYGAGTDFNEETVSLLLKRGCMAAFTTESRTCSLEDTMRLVIPRLDTNDVPRA
jgi:hypothetical protein